MLCPKCGVKAYHYEHHKCWQCPNSACNHNWRDDEIEAPSAAEIDAKAKARRQQIRIQAALAEAAGLIAEAIPDDEGREIGRMIESVVCRVVKAI